MELALLIIIVCLVLLQHMKVNALRREVKELSDYTNATDELIRKLCQIIINAQAAEQDAEDARDAAVADLRELQSETQLSAETKEILGRVLGNAVGAPPVVANPVPVPGDTDGDGVVDSLPGDTDAPVSAEPEAPIDEPVVDETENPASTDEEVK